MSERSVIDQISDDWNFLCEMRRDAISKGELFYDRSRQAHYARLFVVFGDALCQGYKEIVLRRFDLVPPLSWLDVLDLLMYPHGYITVGTKRDLARVLDGIHELRNMIAHGLTSDLARDYAKKKRAILSTGLDPDGSKLTDRHSAIVQKTIQNVINILGGSWAAYLARLSSSSGTR